MADSLSALSRQIDYDKLSKTQSRVHTISKEVNEMVDIIVNAVCVELDNYIHIIDSILTNQEVPVTDYQLDDFTLNIPALLYFVSDKQETLGIQEDVANAVRKEVYNRVREKAQGTVADKDTAAELQAQEETIIYIVESRAYKKVKLRVEAAWEMLNSVKKVMTRRIAEYGISSTDPGRSGGRNT